MKISIYELMGLIKDDKAPKKIKIYDDIFELSVTHYYLNGILEREKDLYYKISGGYATLNDTVEILPEENDEWEDIEKLNYTLPSTHEKGKLFYKDGHYNTLRQIDITILDKINSIIKNQKYMKERLDKNDCVFEQEKVSFKQYINEKLESKDE